MGNIKDCKNRKRIGIMGGTFDPIHIGHLILGEKTYEQLNLDKILFLPSGNPPHKRHREGRATDLQRTEMVRLAIEGNEHFEASFIEMEDIGFTYTYHTLERLHESNPDTDYYFIIGTDSLLSFDTWMEPQKICNTCTLVVAVRDHVSNQEISDKINELTERYHGRFLLLNSENIDISSQLLRTWIKDGKSTRYYLPDSVMTYIEENGIYASKREDGDSIE